MATMLSPHFALEEFLAAQTAARLGIDSDPDPTAFANLRPARRCHRSRAHDLAQQADPDLVGLPLAHPQSRCRRRAPQRAQARGSRRALERVQLATLSANWIERAPDALRQLRPLRQSSSRSIRNRG